MGRTLPAVLAAILLASAAVAYAEIKVQLADRKINLQSQFARITESLKIKNTGSADVDAVISCVLQGPTAVVAFAKATEIASGKDLMELKADPTTVEGAPNGARCFRVHRKVAAGDTAIILMTYVVANSQTPFPSEITQTDTQLVLYEDNVYITSPYTVSSQSTEVTAASSTIKSYTDSEKPVSKSDKTIKYGKYDLVKPWTTKKMEVHFENTKHFKTVVSYVKEIEVSHWGNIYVEEKYEIKNTGARHTGSFSRLKYAHSYNGKANSFQTLTATFPANAHSLYYVDLIGNISSSNTRKTIRDTVVEFDLRYPLMGGWKTDFTLGYSLPLQGFLFGKRSDGRRRLTMSLSSPLEDVYVEDLTVKVVLPEGSSRIHADLPYEMDQSFDKKYTYLDTSGRPVLVLHKKHIVPEHQAKFSVDYAFPITAMAHEPFLLITFYFCLFAAVIAYNRLELTISRDDKWQEAKSREVLATFMEQIQGVIEDEMAAMSGIAKAAGTVRDAAGVDSAMRDKAVVEKKLKDLDERMKPLLTAVEGRSPRVAGQVRDVLEKVRGLQAKYGKLLAERVDLVKKGTGMTELSRRLAPTQAALNDGKREVENAIEGLFGAY